MITTVLNVWYAGVLISSCFSPAPEQLVCFIKDAGNYERYELTTDQFTAAMIEAERIEPGIQIDLQPTEVNYNETDIF